MPRGFDHELEVSNPLLMPLPDAAPPPRQTRGARNVYFDDVDDGQILEVRGVERLDVDEGEGEGEREGWRGWCFYCCVM